MTGIEKLEGDIFWTANDTENAINDPFDELENVSEGDIVEFEQAKRLPNFFGVLIGGEEHYFDTEKEAEEAVERSKHA